MKNVRTFDEFVNENIRPDQIEQVAKTLAHSMPNHTKYDHNGLPTDDQILKAFKYIPDLKYVKDKQDQKAIIDRVKEIMNESESLNENRFNKLSPILLLMGEAGFIKQGKTSTDQFDHENYEFTGGNQASWDSVKADLKKLLTKTVSGSENNFSDGKDYAIKLSEDGKTVTLVALKDKIPSVYFKMWLETK